MLRRLMRGRLCLGRARNGLSDEDEQEVLKPTSRGLSAGKGGTHADREAERTIAVPPTDYRLSCLKFLQRYLRLLEIRLCGVGVLHGFRDQSGSPDVESNPRRLQSCRYTWCHISRREAKTQAATHTPSSETHRVIKPCFIFKYVLVSRENNLTSDSR